MALSNLLAGLANNASQVSSSEAAEQIESWLVSGEKVVKAFRLVRDMFIFTNARLILVDIQGVTGKKVSYESIPYRSILKFAIVTAGNAVDLDAELQLWLYGMSTPIEYQVSKKVDVADLQRTLAYGVLRGRTQ